MTTKKRKKNRTAAPPGPPPRRKGSPGNKTYARGIYAAAGVVAVAVYVLLQAQSPTVEYRFDDEKTAGKWKVQGQARTEPGPTGLLVKPRGVARLVSPRLRRPGAGPLNWHDFPYVKLRIAPAEEERRAALVWFPGEASGQGHELFFTIPAEESEILLDVRQDLPWERRFGWNKLPDVPVTRLGILIQDTVEIREVSLLSGIGPFAGLRLLWSQYWKVEPIKVSSINVHYGNEVFGMPLTTTAGVAFSLLFAWALFNRRPRIRVPLYWAMFACFVAPEAPFILTLWHQAEASSEISAWHADRYDEYRSRFGREFADLDREFQNHVPRGARVAFPDSKRRLVQGESNWVWFLYYGLYENYKDRNRNSARLDKSTRYVFYYYPSGLIHDEGENLVRGTGDQDGPRRSYKTETIVRVSEGAKILKIVHD